MSTTLTKMTLEAQSQKSESGGYFVGTSFYFIEKLRVENKNDSPKI